MADTTTQFNVLDGFGNAISLIIVCIVKFEVIQRSNCVVVSAIVEVIQRSNCVVVSAIVEVIQRSNCVVVSAIVVSLYCQL
jgi:hypothetical protein